MSAAAAITFSDDCMHVSGALDFTSVIDLERKGEAWLRTQAPASCSVNLSAVDRCNSAGTVLLMSWLRTAAAVGKNLAIAQAPQSLLALIHLDGLDNVLPAFEAAGKGAPGA